MTALALSPDIQFSLHRLGREGHPLMVVDQVLANPDALIDQAAAAEWYVPEHTHYPGRNAAVPEAYYGPLIAGIRGPLEAAFGLPRAAGLDYFGFFALASTGAGEATSVQKIPHHDSPNPGRLALVHYLCRGDFGGTGFFRHKATGFEAIDGRRHNGYLAVVGDELAATPGQAYAGEGMDHYDLIGRSDAVFNRLIVYRSHVLHSGLLGEGRLADDPRTGRLTVNGFIEARP